MMDSYCPNEAEPRALYRATLLIRRFEERVAEFFAAGEFLFVQT